MVKNDMMHILSWMPQILSFKIVYGYSRVLLGYIRVSSDSSRVPNYGSRVSHEYSRVFLDTIKSLINTVAFWAITVLGRFLQIKASLISQKGV